MPQVDFAKEVLRRHRALIKEYDEMIMRIELPGIGFINAINFICITENNTTFKNARQYASYIGVAPHRKDSGKSVHWRAKPSAKCDGQAKADLGQGAEIAVVNRGTKYYSKAIGTCQATPPTGQENYDGDLSRPSQMQS